MSSVWNNYRTQSADWPRDAQQNSLSRFSAKVDLLFYAAVAALAVCLGALLLG